MKQLHSNPLPFVRALVHPSSAPLPKLGFICHVEDERVFVQYVSGWKICEQEVWYQVLQRNDLLFV